METNEPGRTLDLETVKYVPFYDGPRLTTLNVDIYGQNPYDLRNDHIIEVSAHKY